MQEECWMKWEPISGLSKRFNINKISETGDCLKITLSTKNDTIPRLQLLFENSIMFFRKTNESFWLCPESPIVDEQQEPISNGTFFKVKNSFLIKWLQEESDGFYEEGNLIHLVLVEGDFLVEIVSTIEPKFEWVEHVA